jgi:hypothetical protein
MITSLVFYLVQFSSLADGTYFASAQRNTFLSVVFSRNNESAEPFVSPIL